jgi:predicted nucleic acid-binding protein
MWQIFIVIDTATLVPASLRDLLLRLADKGLYLIRWSEETLVELDRTLTQKQKVKKAKINRLIKALKKAFPSVTVSNKEYDSLIPQLQNDPKDRHVLATALVTGAKIIVTPNLKDFPEQILQTLGVQAISPDEFWWHYLLLSPKF